jgi:RNA polymerase sigma factor (sigma-70 family)
MQPQEYRATAREVRRLARPYLSDADLEDAIQAVAIKVWQTSDQVDDSNRGVATYRYRTTSSAVLDYLRHRGRRLRELPTDPEHLRPPPEPSPEDELIGQETVEQIRRVFVRAWQSMSDRQRERFREALGGRRMNATRSTFDSYTARTKIKILRAAKVEGCPDQFEKSRLIRFFGR